MQKKGGTGQWIREEKAFHWVSKMRTQAFGCVHEYKSTVGYPNKKT